jgi:hypothetical protein
VADWSSSLAVYYRSAMHSTMHSSMSFSTFTIMVQNEIKSRRMHRCKLFENGILLGGGILRYHKNWPGTKF